MSEATGQAERGPDRVAVPEPVGDGVVVSIIDGGTWSATYGLCLSDMQLFDAFGPRRFIRPGCGYVRDRASTMGLVAARNASVERFLTATTAEWLLMIDTDMGFNPTLVEELLDGADPDERPVMSALTFKMMVDKTLAAPMRAHRFRIEPVMSYWFDVPADEATGRPAESGFAPIFDYPLDAIVRVDGTGAACLLAHRSALLKVAAKYGPRWFDQMSHPSGNPDGSPRRFSEDLSFCIRLAAVGIPLHVDTRVKTTHDKGMIYLDEVTYQLQRQAELLDKARVRAGIRERHFCVTCGGPWPCGEHPEALHGNRTPEGVTTDA